MCISVCVGGVGGGWGVGGGGGGQNSMSITAFVCEKSFFAVFMRLWRSRGQSWTSRRTPHGAPPPWLLLGDTQTPLFVHHQENLTPGENEKLTALQLAGTAEVELPVSGSVIESPDDISFMILCESIIRKSEKAGAHEDHVIASCLWRDSE